MCVGRATALRRRSLKQSPPRDSVPAKPQRRQRSWGSDGSKRTGKLLGAQPGPAARADRRRKETLPGKQPPRGTRCRVQGNRQDRPPLPPPQAGRGRPRAQARGGSGSGGRGTGFPPRVKKSWNRTAVTAARGRNETKPHHAVLCARAAERVTDSSERRHRRLLGRPQADEPARGPSSRPGTHVTLASGGTEMDVVPGPAGVPGLRRRPAGAPPPGLGSTAALATPRTAGLAQTVAAKEPGPRGQGGSRSTQLHGAGSQAPLTPQDFWGPWGGWRRIRARGGAGAPFSRARPAREGSPSLSPDSPGPDSPPTATAAVTARRGPLLSHFSARRR